MELRRALEVLHWLRQHSSVCESEDGQLIVFRLDSRDELEEELRGTGLPFNERGAESITVDTQDCDGLFFDREHFRREVVEKRRLFDQNIGILDYRDGLPLYYDCASRATFIGGQTAPEDLFIENCRDYLQFFDLFAASEVAEYHSLASREFILVAPEKGKFLVGYPPLPPEFPKELRVADQLARLRAMNPSPDFRQYFEMQIIDSLSSFEHDERFPRLVEQLVPILEKSDNSYKLFLSKFDFEKFRRGFNQKRDEYFKSIRDVIDGLLGKVVGIPVSISAAALAIYNLGGDPQYSRVVVAAFAIYSLFTAYLMRLSHASIFDIEDALEADIAAISAETHIERRQFNREENKVRSKIRQLGAAIVIMQALLLFLSLAVILIYAQMRAYPLGITILAIVTLSGIQVMTAFAKVRPARTQPQSN